MAFELIESLKLKVEHLVQEEKEKLEEELKSITTKIEFDEVAFKTKFIADLNKVEQVLNKYKVEIEDKL